MPWIYLIYSKLYILYIYILLQTRINTIYIWHSHHPDISRKNDKIIIIKLKILFHCLFSGATTSKSTRRSTPTNYLSHSLHSYPFYPLCSNWCVMWHRSMFRIRKKSPSVFLKGHRAKKKIFFSLKTIFLHVSSHN